MESFHIHSPTLSFNNGIIKSEAFDDIYHSEDGACEEANTVFIKGNDLEARWLDVSGNFGICELGFGLGISFIETLRRWKDIRGEGILYYTSIEAFPVSKTQLAEAYTSHLLSIHQDNEYRNAIKHLIEQYPKLMRGFHRIYFEEWKVILTLLFEHAEVALDQLSMPQDAWFLDGFSPRKNPDMWSEGLFGKIYQLTKSGGTFSTYSVSRSVKDNASHSGFKIEVRDGFKSKKHMLVGSKKNSASTSPISPKKVAIIGGGISGFSVAHALCKRGIACTIFEKEASCGMGASSNQAAVIMPLLSSRCDELSEFYLNGFLYSLRELREISRKHLISSLRLDGALRIASVKKWATVRERFYELGLAEIGRTLNAEEINSTYLLSQEKDGIFFFDGGSVKPLDVISSIQNIHKGRLQVSCSSAVQNIQELLNLGFSEVVIANAYSSAFIAETAWLPVEKIKGQLFTALLKENNHLAIPSMPICYDGYITPTKDEGHYIIGATYEHNRHETEFDPSVANDLSQRMHVNTGLEVAQVIDGKVCFRTTSPDRLPMIGRHCNKQGEYIDHLYISLGHGSRGMVSCLLSGEIIADEISRQQVPIPRHLQKAISPMRFIMREKKRNVSTEQSYPASYTWRGKIS